jgi:hypothetical protein
VQEDQQQIAHFHSNANWPCALTGTAPSKVHHRGAIEIAHFDWSQHTVQFLKTVGLAAKWRATHFTHVRNVQGDEIADGLGAGSPSGITCAHLASTSVSRREFPCNLEHIDSPSRR